MKKIKEKFQNDPMFAVAVILSSAVIATGLLKAVSASVVSAAYAYRASKL